MRKLAEANKRHEEALRQEREYQERLEKEKQRKEEEKVAFQYS